MTLSMTLRSPLARSNFSRGMRSRSVPVTRTKRAPSGIFDRVDRADVVGAGMTRLQPIPAATTSSLAGPGASLPSVRRHSVMSVYSRRLAVNRPGRAVIVRRRLATPWD